MRYEEDYAAANPGWHLEDAADKAHEVLAAISRAGLMPRSICDIGCGVGAVLERVHAGTRAERSLGYDLSKHAVEVAQHRSRPGLDYVVADAALDPTAFDLMLVLDVVEHVPDPVAFMRSIRHKAPLAILNIPLELTVLKVLSAESLVRGRRALGHIHYFNEALAREMLREAGYVVRDSWISPPGTGRSLSVARRLLWASQRQAASVAPSLAARTIGGCSVILLAESQSG